MCLPLSGRTHRCAPTQKHFLEIYISRERVVSIHCGAIPRLEKWKQYLDTRRYRTSWRKRFVAVHQYLKSEMLRQRDERDIVRMDEVFKRQSILTKTRVSSPTVKEGWTSSP